MIKKYATNLMEMHATGKEIATIFAGTVAPDRVLAMTQELLDVMTTNGPESHDSRLMLLGALAALGDETAVSCCAGVPDAAELSSSLKGATGTV